MMSDHSKYRFSITISSNDLAVINCLRSLAQFRQKTENNRIPWGGTKDKDWLSNNKQVTFHFSSIDYRELFVAEINRLFYRRERFSFIIY